MKILLSKILVFVMLLSVGCAFIMSEVNAAHDEMDMGMVHESHDMSHDCCPTDSDDSSQKCASKISKNTTKNVLDTDLTVCQLLLSFSEILDIDDLADSTYSFEHDPYSGNVLAYSKELRSRLLRL